MCDFIAQILEYQANLETSNVFIYQYFSSTHAHSIITDISPERLADSFGAKLNKFVHHTGEGNICTYYLEKGGIRVYVYRFDRYWPW